MRKAPHPVRWNRQRGKDFERRVARLLKLACAQDVETVGILGRIDVKATIAGRHCRIECKTGLGGQTLAHAAQAAYDQAVRHCEQGAIPLAWIREGRSSRRVWVCTTAGDLTQLAAPTDPCPILVPERDFLRAITEGWGYWAE